MSTTIYTRSIQSVLDEIDMLSSDIIGSFVCYQSNASLENTRVLMKTVQVFVENDNLQKSITQLMNQTFNKYGIEDNQARVNGYLYNNYQALIKNLKNILEHQKIQNIHAPFVIGISGARKKKIKKVVKLVDRIFLSSDGLVGIAETIHNYYEDKQENVSVGVIVENDSNYDGNTPHEQHEQPPPWFGFDEYYDYDPFPPQR